MNNMNTLTVYLGSSGHCANIYKDAARALGAEIGRSGKTLVYGGMDAGLMGLLALSALEAGGDVAGIVPRKIDDSKRILEGLTQTILVDELCERKKQMFLMADAILALPGGFGTLDESLEVLYWGSLKLHSKPLVLINIEGYWDDLIAYIETLPDFDPQYLIIVEKVEDAIPALEKWEAPPPVKTPLHFPHFEDEIGRATNQPIVVDIPTLENTYFAVCAIGLKQLGKHTRPIGFLNENNAFDGLLAYFKRASEETFITKKCLGLYASHENAQMLHSILDNQESIDIDLQKEKWGASVTSS